MSMYCCPVCDCGPMSMAHMYQHLRRAHNWTDEQIREEEMSIKEKKLSEQRQYKCESCDRTFYNDQSWRLHWKRAHGGMKRISGLYVVCPGCQQKFSDNAELVKHWREEHEQEADQSVDPNFVLATLNRTLRELDTLKRRKRPELSNPGWRWRSKKKNSEEPQVQEPDNQKEDRDTPDDILFDTMVKQEEPGPSRDLDQGTSRVEMVNKDQTESLGENVSKKTEQKQKTSGKRRANETPEQRAERRRFKAERERFRRWQMKARREKEREVISHVRQVMEIVPQKPEGSSRNYHLAGGDITQAVKVQASQRGSITPLGKGKSKCFALVGIKSEEERQRFLDLAVSNGFYDVMFLNDPLGKSLSDAKDSKQQSQPNKCVTPPPQKYGNVNATTEKEVGDPPQTSFANVDNGVSKLSSTMVKDESVTNEDQPELPFNREDRESSCSSQSSEIGQVSTTKRNGDAVQRPRNRCLVCGLHGHPDETRISSRRRQQNVILFSCLLAQNIITKKEAYEMNNETQKSHTLICHDHYIQAADYLGKRVELLCGKFPEKGLYLIASEVKDDLLSLVLDHAKSLDADTVVHVGDLSRFFHDCLMNYYSKDGWSLQEKNPTSPDEKQEEGQKQTTTMEQPSTSSRQSPPIIKNPNAEVKPCSSDGLPSAIKVDAAKEDESAQLEPKKEIGEDICEISAMDLLEPSVPDEASTSPVIVINSTSDESKASVSKSPQKVSQKGYEANRYRSGDLEILPS
ncbi:hypothetical protein GCK32_011225 [Trichostrongylus colubriformis]|uniref:C2H2-type domain-containing protein n=1 Tax=Trichostrongylus colubriformis TaxID=6319 RepID=A0AAN8F6N8_TRICO